MLVEAVIVYCRRGSTYIKGQNSNKKDIKTLQSKGYIPGIISEKIKVSLVRLKLFIS